MLCGDDSDCTTCVKRKDERKFKESRKHAGLTRRSQISGPSTHGFRSSRDFRRRTPSDPLPTLNADVHQTHGCLHTIESSCTLGCGPVKSVGSKFFRIVVGVELAGFGANEAIGMKRAMLGTLVLRNGPEITSWNPRSQRPSCGKVSRPCHRADRRSPASSPGRRPAVQQTPATLPRSYAPAWERSSCRSAARSRSIREVIPDPVLTVPRAIRGAVIPYPLAPNS